MFLIDELERLHQLREAGGLTDAEYTAAKRKLLEPASPHPIAALRRRRNDAWLAGLCVGLQSYTGMPAPALRLGFALLALVGGVGLVLYTVMALVVPIEES